MIYLLSLNHVSKLHQRSYLDCSLSRYIYLIFCFVFLWPKFKRKKKGRYRLFDVHFQYTPMGNALTPSKGSKIRLTRKRYRKSGENQRRHIMSDGILRYLFVEWNPMGSMGIQRCPSTSTEISGLVANLTSDKCNINEIRHFLKAIERNSSFQARMTWIYTLFFRPVKQNSALRQQMQYAWNMARFLSHEAKQLI